MAGYQSPFENIKVVEVGQFASGPMCGRLLADWGADVIHVEHPLRGDPQRFSQSWTGVGRSASSPINYTWENINRNKKSITLDLSKEQGREILYKLLEKADVFLTNVRLSDIKKFGTDYESLSRINPRIIYAGITGYGKKGPDRDLPGYDASAYLARSGQMHMLQETGYPPPPARPAFGDFPTGLITAFGVTMALLVRERTGLGQEVETSLYNSGVFALSYDISEALSLKQDVKKISRGESLNPLQSAYETKDGRWLRLSVVQPDLYWSKFCKAIKREELEKDSRFDSFESKARNHLALFEILEEVFKTRSLAEWKPRLDGAVPWSPVQTPLDVVHDPQARANEFFVAFNHPVHGVIEMVAPPIKLKKTPASIRTPAPEFSQHTEEVLLGLGYTWKDIDEFKKNGVIA